SPSFKMSQPDLLLEFLIVAFDPPSQLGNVDELAERDVLRKRRQPIFDRLLLAFGPFNQQPLLRPTVGEPVIPMRDTNAHTGKSRGQLLPRGFPPCDRAPGTLWQGQCKLLDRGRFVLVIAAQLASVVAHDPTTSLADAALCQVPIRSCVTGCRRH